MKIAINLIPFSTISGIEIFSKNLILNLLKIKGDEEFYILGSENMPELLDFPQVELIKIKGLKVKYSKALHQQTLIYPLLKKYKIDLLFSPSPAAPFFYKNKVVVIHDCAYDRFKEFENILSKIYFRAMFYGAKYFSKRIITVSNFSKRELVELYKINPDKIAVIYEGVPELPEVREEFIQKTLAKFKIDSSYFLYIGNWRPRKNLPGLIKAFKLFREKGFDYFLVIGGRKDKRFLDLEKEIKKNKLEGKVILTDALSREEVAALYKKAKALTFPSYYEGFGLPCLPPETNVITREGVKQIKEIKVGDCVLTHLGKFKNTTRIFKRKINGKIIEIQPYSFNTPIQLTPEHPILAFKRPSKKWKKGKRENWWSYQKPTWMPAKDIKKGDCVIFPIPQGEQKRVKNFDLKDFDKNLKSNRRFVWYKMGYSPKTERHLKVKRFVKINKELAKLIGIYIAEGSTNSKKFNSIEFSLGFEPSLAREIKSLVKAIFGVDSLIKKERNKLRVIISGKILAKFFAELCGAGALNKKIVPTFLYGDRKILRIVIEYIKKGDGCKVGDRISFSTSSKQLVNDIKIALLRLGQRANIGEYKRKKKTNEEFSINFSLNNTKNYSHSNKSWFLKNKGYCAFLVKKSKKVPYIGKVYNLEVEEDNSYVTESFAVHNCLEAQSLGIPVLTSNTSSLPEVGGDSVLYVDPYSIEDITRGMEKIAFDEKLREDLIKKGFENIKRFSWEKTARELLALFYSLERT